MPPLRNVLLLAETVRNLLDAATTILPYSHNQKWDISHIRNGTSPISEMGHLFAADSLQMLGLSALNKD